MKASALEHVVFGGYFGVMTAWKMVVVMMFE